MAAPFTWDIFCRVVDNFGDAGVCWRLARQLAAEHGARVRLWIDDLDILHRLNPAVAAKIETQDVGGVRVCRWAEPLPDVLVGDQVGPQDLQRDLAADGELAAAIDRPHAAGADLAQHLVALQQDPPDQRVHRVGPAAA